VANVNPRQRERRKRKRREEEEKGRQLERKEIGTYPRSIPMARSVTSDMVVDGNEEKEEEQEKPAASALYQYQNTFFFFFPSLWGSTKKNDWRERGRWWLGSAVIAVTVTCKYCFWK